MNIRLQIVRSLIFIAGFVVLGRLFYWQVLQSSTLAAEAVEQRTATQVIDAQRGSILASDGYVLTANRDYYLLYAYKPQLEIPHSQIAQDIAPLILPEPKDATEAAIPKDVRLASFQTELQSKLDDVSKKWVPLFRGLTREQKKNVEKLDILGLGFDEYQRRYYPEASMSAHVLGFVGRDDLGNPQGYFGLEGNYNLELQGKQGKVTQELDAKGKPILIGMFDQLESRKGRDLQLHLDRTLQFMAEDHLKKGIEKYEALSGEILIMEPKTGGILASASFPNYDPADIGAYPTEHYKNPIIANSYEPGSTFKVLVMAAGIEEGVIEPDTVCGSACAGPTKIGKYSIKTWNLEYDPTQTMTEVLANSDNTGMVFVANKLGKEVFVDYIDRLGFGRLTDIDLQEESSPYLREKWGDIDVATASFGQGIAVNGVQIVRAVGAIANEGKLMKPKIVKKVIDGDREIPINPEVEEQIFSPETADTVREMMIESAHGGESQWAVLQDYQVAGKTGTAQIAVEGEYDEEKTNVSFVGFAPAHDPKFVMLVKMREPQSSPWAAETAAPLWYDLAHDILVYYNIPPKK